VLSVCGVTAGDFVKFGFPMAWSTTTLAWGLLEYWDAYDKAGELKNMM
jgi:endoglucanase